MLRSPDFISGGDPAGAPPPLMGWIFVAVGSLFFLAGWAMVAALIFAGKYLRRRTQHTFCLVVAGISCMFMPFGTALGVFSLVVLTRPHVKAWFDAAPLPAGSPYRADPAPFRDWR